MLIDNVIGFYAKAKESSVCKKSHSMGIVPREYACCVSWDGASGWMEAAVALKVYNHIYVNSECNIYIGAIISDDDSTM